MSVLIPLILQYRYLVLFPLAAIEGPIIALVVGFLIRLNFLSFWPSYLILILGDIIPDTIYYLLGRSGSQSKLWVKYSQSKSGLLHNFSVIERLWQTHPRKTMFFSKLAYGLSTPFLISAGLVKMPFKKFISLTIPITLGQYVVILGLGYLLGNSYELAAAYIKDAGLIVAGLVLIIGLIYFFLSRYARREIAAMETTENKN